MKLKNKIHLYTSVLFIGLLIFMNVMIYLLFKNLLIESEITKAEREIEKIINGVTTSLTSIEPKALFRAYVPVDGSIELVRSDGSVPLMVTSDPAQTETSEKGNFFPGEKKGQIQIDESHYHFHSVPVIWTDGEIVNVQVIKNIDTPYDHLAVLQKALTAASVIAIIPIIVSGGLLSHIIVKPISSIIQTMEGIIKSGKFHRIHLQSRSKDELGQLADTFNRMIQLLETNFSKQDQFLSNASHELKTPLTVIESYANLLKRRGPENRKIFEESIEAIHSEARRMKEMTEQLLLLARPLEKRKVELSLFSPTEILAKAADSFKKTYNREVVYTEEEPITLRTDKNMLKQLVYIFLENAVKYSNERITITSGYEGKVGFIRIADRGIGIPTDELPKVFDRFYRVDKARSRHSGGSGLGLSLAKEIAEAIGVTIQIESAVGVGTSVTISLPVHHPEKTSAEARKHGTT